MISISTSPILPALNDDELMCIVTVAMYSVQVCPPCINVLRISIFYRFLNSVYLEVYLSVLNVILPQPHCSSQREKTRGCSRDFTLHRHSACARLKSRRLNGFRWITTIMNSLISTSISTKYVIRLYCLFIYIHRDYRDF